MLLMLMPLLLAVIIPVACFTALSLVPVPENSQPPEALVNLMSENSVSGGYRAFWIDAFTTLLCPMLFLAVPIICSVTSASCLFIGEKENSTLETILLSSMSSKTVYHVKVITCVMVSAAISLISFLAFTVTVTVADILVSVTYFLSFEWIVTAFLLMPALCLFSVVFVSMIIKRVYSSVETLQTMGYLLLPVILLYLIQFTGAFRISPLFLIFLALLLLAAAVVMFNYSSRRFTPEILFYSDGEERG